jgi:hypothetical protein
METFRFLKVGEADPLSQVVLASYPRSGNSLMRKLVEKCTGIFTGSDTRPDRTLGKSLFDFGMKGEGVVDDTVHLVKTHYPERAGYLPFNAGRAILLVRNPYDAIDSYFNMTLTNTHNKSMAEDQYTRFSAAWDELLRSEIQIWQQFHRYWLKQQVPLLVVRFEDLVQDPRKEMARICCFMARKESLEKTDWGDSVMGLEEQSTANSGPYKPRSGKIGGSFRHYTVEQRAFMQSSAEEMMRQFGYHADQGFPSEISPPAEELCMRHLHCCDGTGAQPITMNKGPELRSKLDPCKFPPYHL